MPSPAQSAAMSFGSFRMIAQSLIPFRSDSHSQCELRSLVPARTSLSLRAGSADRMQPLRCDRARYGAESCHWAVQTREEPALTQLLNPLPPSVGGIISAQRIDALDAEDQAIEDQVHARLIRDLDDAVLRSVDRDRVREQVEQ